MIPEIETALPAQIIAQQEKLLKKQLLYLEAHSPFYAELFKSNNINIQNINSLSDLATIPVTTKEMVQKLNSDFYCVPKNQIIDYVTTSGTLGSPVTFVLTDKDLDRLAYNEFLSFGYAGVNDQSIILLTTTIDKCFMAGMAYFLGARKAGAGIIRSGPGIPELQWDMIKRHAPDILIGVPSFILKLIEYAENHQIDFKASSIKKAICIGEPIRDKDFNLNILAKKITDKWDIKLFSTYASTEMSTAFTECEYGCGGHQHPELIILELLDEHDMPVKNEDEGELTITTLGIEGMPLLRYKTGDICKIHTDSCKCGRTTVRVGPITGRKQHMIKYKGTTLYPNAFKDILTDIAGIKRYLIEAFTNELGTDELIVHIHFEGSDNNTEKIIQDRFRAALRVSPGVNLCSDQYLDSLLPKSYSRKPVEFIDKRSKE